MIVVTLLPLLLLAEFMEECSSAKTTVCKEKYLRFSSEHTMCKFKNINCVIYKRGVTVADKKLILAMHNKLRNKIATGKERKAGGMPEAANMLEMVWDDELAREAQKHADQCYYTHDCNECRTLEEYKVGQIIGEMRVMKRNSEKEKNWRKMINTFYDEFNYFDTSVIDSYVPGEANPVARYGYMTQLIWAKTWRIGCGWVLKAEGVYNTSFYVCNYGPTGNVVSQKMYEVGEACSKCPENTCCGRKSCRESGIKAKYPGLCKIIDEMSAPQEAPGISYVFFCSFNGESDCLRKKNEKLDWELMKTVGGNWIRLVLDGGESSTLVMDKPFKSSNYEDLCFHMLLRTSNYAGSGNGGVASTLNFLNGDEKMATFRLKPWNTHFTFSAYDFDLKLPRGDENKISIKFSVPVTMEKQVIDITHLSVVKGLCYNFY